MTEQLALRFPDGTRARIRALARPGEPMTNVILRALDGLSDHGEDRTTDRQDNVQHQIDDLMDRVAALEGKPSTTHQRPINDATDRDKAMERVRQLRDTGASFQQIAGTLNREGIPTLSGRGQWQGGTVGRLLTKGDGPMQSDRADGIGSSGDPYAAGEKGAGFG